MESEYIEHTTPCSAISLFRQIGLIFENIPRLAVENVTYRLQSRKTYSLCFTRFEYRKVGHSQIDSLGKLSQRDLSPGHHNIKIYNYHTVNSCSCFNICPIRSTCPRINNITVDDAADMVLDLIQKSSGVRLAGIIIKTSNIKNSVIPVRMA